MDHPDIVDLLNAALEAHANELRVALPGVIVKYYEETNTADVRVSVKQRLAETDDAPEEWQEFPTLRNIPVKFPRTENYAVTFPMAEGDRVDVNFSDVNLSTWRAGGEEERDPQVHGIGGAYCSPGLYPDSKAWPNANSGFAVLEHRTGGRVAVGPLGAELGRGAGLAPLPTLASVQAAIAAVAAYAASIPGAPPPAVIPAVVGTTAVTAK